MKKIYLTEAQLKGYLNFLKEEEYSEIKRFGPFKTRDAAESMLKQIREVNGFSDYDSWIDGNFVVVQIEKSKLDDKYVDDMTSALNNQYCRVAESRD